MDGDERSEDHTTATVKRIYYGLALVLLLAEAVVVGRIVWQSSACDGLRWKVAEERKRRSLRAVDVEAELPAMFAEAEGIVRRAARRHA